MASSYHTPERKIEQAIKMYFDSVAGAEFNGVQINTRFGNMTLTEPRIDIVCEECEPWPDPEVHEADTGNWKCPVKITVSSHYEKDLDAAAHDEIAGQVADKLILVNGSADALASTIMAAIPSDTAIDIFDAWRGARSNRVEEHTIITEQAIIFVIAVDNV